MDYDPFQLAVAPRPQSGQTDHGPFEPSVASKLLQSGQTDHGPLEHFEASVAIPKVETHTSCFR